jgi:uncharacterized protein (DUF58 family)
MLTPDELLQIRRLQLLLQRRVDSPFAGEYRSAFRGLGMEFEEVRPYAPGDDIRHIDWNVTARAGEPFVKQFREERELTLLLVLDISGSMRFGGGGRDGRTDKRLQLARVAGALAWAGISNGDRVGMLAFTEQIEHHLPPRRARGHAWQILRTAYAPPPSRRGTDLVTALERVHRTLKRKAVICVLSDFVADPAPDRILGILARKHQVHGFLVHDPLEHALPRGLGLIELEDAETGRRRLVDTATWAAAERVERRVERIQRAGVRCTAVSTADDPFHRLLGHFRRTERSR